MINLALIGVGAWGRNYVATSKKLPNVTIKYLCALSDKNLSSFAGEFIKVTNYQQLFNFSDIDGVIIASPNATHHQITYDFLKRGFNILVEKPMSEDYQLSKKLLPLQKKNKSVFQVGYIYLFDPAYLKASQLVRTIGNIRYVDFVGTNNGPYRKDTSALWDIGSHGVSLCLDISQKDPKNITAWGFGSFLPKSKYYDFSNLRIQFEDNTYAFIKVSWLFPEKSRKLVVIGEKDSVIYESESDKKVALYKNMVFDDNHVFSKTNQAKPTFPSYSAITPLENELQEFIKAIKARKQVAFSGLELGLKVTKVLNLAEKSIALKGKPINVKN